MLEATAGRSERLPWSPPELLPLDIEDTDVKQNSADEITVATFGIRVGPVS